MSPTAFVGTMYVKKQVRAQTEERVENEEETRVLEGWQGGRIDRGSSQMGVQRE